MITEFHPWFSEEAGASSPWGRPILPPETLGPGRARKRYHVVYML